MDEGTLESSIQVNAPGPPSPPLRNYFLGHGSARAEAVSSAPPRSSKSKEEANRPTFKIDNARRMKLCGTGQLQHSTMVTRSILTLKQGPENLAAALVSEGAFERSFSRGAFQEADGQLGWMAEGAAVGRRSGPQCSRTLRACIRRGVKRTGRYHRGLSQGA